MVNNKFIIYEKCYVTYLCLMYLLMYILLYLVGIGTYRETELTFYVIKIKSSKMPAHNNANKWYTHKIHFDGTFKYVPITRCVFSFSTQPLSFYFFNSQQEHFSCLYLHKKEAKSLIYYF